MRARTLIAIILLLAAIALAGIAGIIQMQGALHR